MREVKEVEEEENFTPTRHLGCQGAFLFYMFHIYETYKICIIPETHIARRSLLEMGIISSLSCMITRSTKQGFLFVPLTNRTSRPRGHRLRVIITADANDNILPSKIGRPSRAHELHCWMRTQHTGYQASFLSMCELVFHNMTTP